jgi:hypothetical protein
MVFWVAETLKSGLFKGTDTLLHTEGLEWLGNVHFQVIGKTKIMRNFVETFKNLLGGADTENSIKLRKTLNVRWVEFKLGGGRRDYDYWAV